MLAKQYAAQIRRSRIALYTFLPFAALAAAGGGVMDYIQPALKLIYIMAGFSLIIFLHELGHFVVARLCSVKCLAFSIGIGPRMCGWRKNGKFSFGNDPYDTADYKAKQKPAGGISESATAEAGAPQKHPASSVQSDLPTTAHEAHHPPAVGDCDYRLSWLPLGGYVRMLGQDDMDPSKISNDPHAFNQRPIWQRMCIVSAGVIMNLIFAAVCFSIIFSPGIGVDFPPATVGSVTYNMPAYGKLHMGDKIVSINGQKPRGFLEFTDVMMEAALSDGSQSITLDFIRYDDGKLDHVTLNPKRSDATGFLAFGIEAMPGLKIGGTGADYTSDDLRKMTALQAIFDKNKPELEKLTGEGWRIVGVSAAGGAPVDLTDAPEPYATHDKYVKFYRFVNRENGAPVDVSFKNDKTGAAQSLELYPRVEYIPGETKYPTVMGLSPQLLAGAPVAKSPADKAGLQDGDRILAVGERSMPEFEQVREIIRATDAKPFSLRVERGNDVIEKTITGERKKDGSTQIGLPYHQDLATTRFTIDPRSDAEAALSGMNLSPRAYIAAVDGTPVADWQDVYCQLRNKKAGQTVRLSLATPGSWTGSFQDVTLRFTAADEDLVQNHIHFLFGFSLQNETKTQKAANVGQAVLMGMDHTKKFILNVYMTLAGLFRGTVDPSNLHGIVGITKVGYDVQERGPVWLWYVLAMVSVNLAVANFLPLPIVDGGLFLLLILEKIRGKPLSLKVQTAIQTVGIVLLASLFLFVTMNDLKLF